MPRTATKRKSKHTGWFDRCVSGVRRSGSASDPEAVCGAVLRRKRAENSGKWYLPYRRGRVNYENVGHLPYLLQHDVGFSGTKIYRPVEVSGNNFILRGNYGMSRKDAIRWITDQSRNASNPDSQIVELSPGHWGARVGEERAEFSSKRAAQQWIRLRSHEVNGRLTPNPSMGLREAQQIGLHARGTQGIQSRTEALKEFEAWYDYRSPHIDQSILKEDMKRAFLYGWGDKSRKRNPESSAAEGFESFTGRPSREVFEVIEDEHYHANVFAVGVLIGLKVRTFSGYDATIEFEKPSEAQSNNPAWWSKVWEYGGPHPLPGGTYKGYRIEKWASDDWRVPQIERASRFDSKRDAQRFIDAWRKNPKRTKGPVGSSIEFIETATGTILKPIKKVGSDIDRHVSRALNPSFGNVVLLTANEAGTQLFMTGGDQSVDLKALKIEGDEAEKESIILGEAWAIAYRQKKDYKDGKPVEELDWVHGFGEEKYHPKLHKGEDLWEDAKPPEKCFNTGHLPMLRYDCVNQKLYLDGGIYKIPMPWGETSPGIEN